MRRWPIISVLFLALGGLSAVAGYDITYADVRGRFVYGTVNYQFR